MTATVNDLAQGTWSTRTGTVLEIVRAGANSRHVIVRHPGERRTFGFPTGWLDMEPEPDRVTARRLRVKGTML